jgi:cell wall-associated NlpC family hydrolase
MRIFSHLSKLNSSATSSKITPNVAHKAQIAAAIVGCALTLAASPAFSQAKDIAKERAKNEFDIRRLISDAESKFSASIATISSAATGSTSASGESENSLAQFGSELVLRAMTLLGINYKFGGNSPETGFDCSGFVRYVFKEAFGYTLPRRSEEISQKGVKIGIDQLVPGDLVFFNTLKRTFSHVGIYIGNNQFVHAPSSGSVVRVESIDKNYWQARFDGARRVLIGESTAPSN